MFALTPFRGQSILDELLRGDEDWFTSLMHPHYHHRHPYHRQQQLAARGKQSVEPWREVIKLPGFNEDQVKIEVSDDKSKVKVLAERLDGEEEFKIRRCIQVPENVDRDRLQCEFIRQGVLLIHAPYKQQQQRRNDQELFPFTSWGALTKDMEEFKQGIEKLLHQSQPGTGDLASEMIRDEATGENKVRLHFDLQGFAPEEIKLEQKGEHGLTVEAKHESSTKGKDGVHETSRYFKRHLELPKNVNVNAMKSQLQANGVLTLEAPCQLSLDNNTQPNKGQNTELQIHRPK